MSQPQADEKTPIALGPPSEDGATETTNLTHEEKARYGADNVSQGSNQDHGGPPGGSVEIERS